MRRIRRRVSNKAIANALVKNLGIIAAAAQQLGVDRSTVSRRMHRSAALATERGEPDMLALAREAGGDIALDIAESKLMAAVNAGDHWAVQFLLKTRGRTRGFAERTEVTGTDGASLCPKRIVLDFSKHLDLQDLEDGSEGGEA